jgi:hypothetical protein
VLKNSVEEERMSGDHSQMCVGRADENSYLVLAWLKISLKKAISLLTAEEGAEFKGCEAMIWRLMYGDLNSLAFVGRVKVSRRWSDDLSECRVNAINQAMW